METLDSIISDLKNEKNQGKTPSEDYQQSSVVYEPAESLAPEIEPALVVEPVQASETEQQEFLPETEAESAEADTKNSPRDSNEPDKQAAKEVALLWPIAPYEYFPAFRTNELAPTASIGAPQAFPEMQTNVFQPPEYIEYQIINEELQAQPATHNVNVVWIPVTLSPNCATHEAPSFEPVQQSAREYMYAFPTSNLTTGRESQSTSSNEGPANNQSGQSIAEIQQLQLSQGLVENLPIPGSEAAIMNYIRPSGQTLELIQTSESASAALRARNLMSPDDAAKIDVSNVVLDEHKLYEIYVGRIPVSATQEDIRRLFAPCGTIKEIYMPETESSQRYAFVNFMDREGAMNAFRERTFRINGAILDLAGFHKELTIILRRIPPLSDQEAFEQTLLDFFKSKGHPNIYAFVQFTGARYGNSVYLHFLSPEESTIAFALLENMEFTKFATQALKLIPVLENARFVDNLEVDRRQQANERPNEDLDREILQFLCVRFQDKQARLSCQNDAPVNMSAQQPESMLSIYVRDIPPNCTAEAIGAAMAEFGIVQHVKVVNQRPGSRFSAVVEFVSELSAQVAIHRGQLNIGGNMVQISAHIRKDKAHEQ